MFPKYIAQIAQMLSWRLYVSYFPNAHKLTISEIKYDICLLYSGTIYPHLFLAESGLPILCTHQRLRDTAVSLNQIKAYSKNNLLEMGWQQCPHVFLVPRQGNLTDSAIYQLLLQRHFFSSTVCLRYAFLIQYSHRKKIQSLRLKLTCWTRTSWSNVSTVFSYVLNYHLLIFSKFFTKFHGSKLNPCRFCEDSWSNFFEIGSVCTVNKSQICRANPDTKHAFSNRSPHVQTHLLMSPLVHFSHLCAARISKCRKSCSHERNTPFKESSHTSKFIFLLNPMYTIPR